MNTNSIYQILAFLAISSFTQASATESFNVRDYGAIGDGKTLDSPAINKAIDAAAAAGGGTVHLPAGKYFSGSIRLKSNIHLHLSKGAVIVADKWDSTSYDPTEPLLSPPYQDGGHTFFQNSLIWGENLKNITISGEGMIDGSGLTSWQGKLNDKSGYTHSGPKALTEPMKPVYAANKAISLKLCTNVILRDITIFKGGWFAILATGCDDVLMENLLIDTNRDGIDIDCCRRVLVKNCKVNSPEDDAICPKSTYALGEARVSEDVTITDCLVSGFELGTFLDGTRQPSKAKREPNGRIKFGTESSGGFRNCTVTNCVFLSCMGFALEEVDGGILENITVKNLRMTDVVNYAIYITTGIRNRTPNLTTTSRLRNISISHVVAEGVSTMSGIQIFGLQDQPLEGIHLSNIKIVTKGGGTRKDAARTPKELGTDYPDPSGKGNMPSYGIFARHAKNLKLHNLSFQYQSEEVRPAARFVNVDGLEIDGFNAQVASGVEVAVLEPDVRNLVVRNAPGIKLPTNK